MDTEAIARDIEDALNQVNGQYCKWEIEFRLNEHSYWFSATSDSTRFDRGSLDQVVKLCRIFNGWNRA